MASAAVPATVQPSTAGGLAYKCFARKFHADSPPVLYLLASGYHITGGYRLFFKTDGGFNWTLMETVPDVAPQMLTWYTASATTSQPILNGPDSVNITDAQGTHVVPVEPWDSTAATTTASAAAANPGTVRLATGDQIAYKVYARPYDQGGGPVLFFLATCSYPTGGWEIFFTSSGSLHWDLLERVPGLVNQLVTYYEASMTTAFGLAEHPASVAIRDAYGTQQVEVVPWFLDASEAAKSTPPPGPRLFV